MGVAHRAALTSVSFGLERTDFYFRAAFWRVGPRSGGIASPTTGGKAVAPEGRQLRLWERRRNIRNPKVAPLDKQRLSRYLRQRVRKALPEIHPGRMPPLPVVRIRLPCC